jgi:hypothetical protein
MKWLGSRVQESFLYFAASCALSFILLLFGPPGSAHPQEFQKLEAVQTVLAETPKPSPFASGQQPDPQVLGKISGTVIDRTGTPVAGARLNLTREGQSQETQSGEDGQFTFASVAPGAFQLTVSAEGFAVQTTSGTLNSGQNYVLPPITLTLATAVTEVRVELSTVEIAQEQLKDQEKQRVLGVIPNFYVTYVPDAAPLNTKQKFQLALKSTVDPVTFVIVAGIAGVQQADGQFSGYGQGAQGYAKRYGASYADIVTSTFIGGAILPSILKQDPRYFYKGTGSTSSRLKYAIANAVICKGDNGKWQFNYSSVLGSLAAGGISNLYYPASDRNGVGLTFENTLIGIGATAGVNILQEFVVRKLTPHLPNQAPPTP